MYLGIDFGTTGARSCVIDENEIPRYEERVAFPAPGAQTPDDWKLALHRLLESIPDNLRAQLQRIAINATSGTVLLCNANLHPVSPALPYYDTRAKIEAEYLKQLHPDSQIICSANSGLAKFLWLCKYQDLSDAAFFMHQADWLAALLTGKGGHSDYHNALKTGYDVEDLVWPEWIMQLPHSELLPQVVSPGNYIGEVNSAIVSIFKINKNCSVHAGTTDSIAAFIASGANNPGEAVTSLGTTLVLKQLSDKKIDHAQFGIYSHRYGDAWLTGGASNAGAGILRHYFSDVQLASLSEQINPDSNSPLNYYPLTGKGERFPVYDPDMLPRLTPRPADDAEFLHGLLQGLSQIEAHGYAKLAELGATPLKRIYTCGGGAINLAWQKMRERLTGFPVTPAQHTEASFGSALMAKRTGIIQHATN